MTFEAFRALSDAEAVACLLECCRSRRFAETIAGRRRELSSVGALKAAAEEAFLALGEEDWLEAFAGHPRIGDLSALRKKFAGAEQGSVARASEATLAALQRRNEEYERKFGFLFIVCATGKTADEMLAILEARLPNDRAAELRNAVLEQAKILRLRLDKIL